MDSFNLPNFMSRSFKKPYITDQQQSRGSKSTASRSVQAKREANRAVRQANKKACAESEKDKLADGKQYRKEYCSWSIRDWSFHNPKDQKSFRK